MKRLRFVWVDDSRSKVEDFRSAIEEGVPELGVSAALELLEIRANVLEELNGWIKNNANQRPNLVIIDHVYNLSLPLGLKGSSVAHIIRGTFHRTPIVCVTALYDKPGMFDQEDISEYTALFPLAQLGDSIESLYVIARDFPKLHSEGSTVREHLVGCLRAPKRDQEDLARVLPEEFQNPRHATTEHRMGRWIWSILLGRPGFLYDRLHTATLLGLTEAGFAKVESLFEKAKYKGVFATAGNPRWWVSEVARLLFTKLSQPEGPDVPQLAGRQLPKITERDFSVCYISGLDTPPPQAVVLLDASRNADRKVVSLQFADRHPRDTRTTSGFEARLILKPRPRPKPKKK